MAESLGQRSRRAQPPGSVSLSASPSWHGANSAEWPPLRIPMGLWLDFGVLERRISMICNERTKVELPLWLWSFWKTLRLLLNDCSLAEGVIIVFFSEALWSKWTQFWWKGPWATLSVRWVVRILLTCCSTLLQSECMGPTASYEWSQCWKRTEEMDSCQA